MSWRQTALVLLVLAAWTAPGCKAKSVYAVMPVPSSADVVEEETHFGEVLERFGPPVFIGEAGGEGFAMLYESIEVHERGAGINLSGYWGVSGGKRKYQACWLFFDGQGMLVEARDAGFDLDVGGGWVAAAKADQSSFGKKDWGAGATPHTWGMRMFGPIPRLLNREYGDIELGQGGLELFDTPRDAGQHTLERPLPPRYQPRPQVPRP